MPSFDRASSDSNDPAQREQQAHHDQRELFDEATDEDSDAPEHRRYTIHRDLQKRLDRYLCDRLPCLSRSKLQKLINEGAVQVNDRQPKSSTVLRSGDIVDVIVPPPAIKQIPAEPIPLEVLYEDDDLIVVNKQPDLVVHPARSNLHGTLVNALAWHFRNVRSNGLEALSSVGVDEFRPGIIHRLDKDTTGCIVVAKTDEAHWRIAKQFEQRTVQKFYQAIVHGEMMPPGDAIDQPIGKHPVVREAYAVRHDSHARHAVTLYRVKQVFRGFSLVELELKTGRTHQIRVHLTWLGFPIISDIIYGGEPIGHPEIVSPPEAAGAQPMLTYARQKEQGVKIWDAMDRRQDLLIRRPALHAATLQFVHPRWQKTMTFHAPLPEDMTRVLKTLRHED